MAQDRSLELTREGMVGIVSAATERVVAHLESLPDQPAANARADDTFGHLREPVPEGIEEIVKWPTVVIPTL